MSDVAEPVRSCPKCGAHVEHWNYKPPPEEMTLIDPVEEIHTPKAIRHEQGWRCHGCLAFGTNTGRRVGVHEAWPRDHNRYPLP